MLGSTSDALGRRLFARRPRSTPYTAIYAASDTTAIGLLQAAHEAGIDVPRDLSIVGFDDIDIAPYTFPPLTTIRQGGVEMGQTAIDLLLEMVEDGAEREDLADHVVQPTLVIRHSTMAPGSERAQDP